MTRTEWEDILIEKGIAEVIDKMDIPPPEGITYSVDEKIGDYSESEDEFDDDEFFDEYKRKRMTQIEKARREFIREISGGEFVPLVSEGSKNGWVALLLFEDVKNCTEYMDMYKEIAGKFAEVTFLKIKSQACIPNYPEKHLPTVLLYGFGELVQRLVGKECHDLEKKLTMNNCN